MAISIVDKLRVKLQRRRTKLSRASSLSTSSISSSTWDYTDWNELGSSEEDEEESPCSWKAPPMDVPQGYLAVYVGEQRKRCVINARHLSHPWFKMVLQKSAEEFGFTQKEGLVLLCEVVKFENMIQRLDRGD